MCREDVSSVPPAFGNTAGRESPCTHARRHACTQARMHAGTQAQTVLFCTRIVIQFVIICFAVIAFETFRPIVAYLSRDNIERGREGAKTQQTDRQTDRQTHERIHIH